MNSIIARVSSDIKDKQTFLLDFMSLLMSFEVCCLRVHDYRKKSRQWLRLMISLNAVEETQDLELVLPFAESCTLITTGFVNQVIGTSKFLITCHVVNHQEKFFKFPYCIQNL